MYSIHPSPKLQGWFHEKPYQGQDPQDARVIIFGIDANFREDVEQHDQFFKKLERYLKNGTTFWKEYGIHHPFLLYKVPGHLFRHEDYALKQNRDGVPYHKYFAKLNLTVDCAEFISFVELLNVPTVGNTKKEEFSNLFCHEHARWLDQKINTYPPKLILLSNGVIEIMRAKKETRDHGIFWWIPDRDDKASSGESKIVKLTTPLDDKGYKIYRIPHFSAFAYIKKEKQKQILKAIEETVLPWCRNT